MESYSTLLAVKERIRTAHCSVLLDIDETILSPLHRWTEHIRSFMRLEDLTVQQVKDSGGLDGVFCTSPLYAKFKTLIASMRVSEELHSDLEVVEGAFAGTRKLLEIPNFEIAGYLTARSVHVTHVTKIDLQRKGFPLEPIIARPPDVARELTTQWKISVLEELAKDHRGILILVDDAIPTMKALWERNRSSNNFIVAILFDGSLSHATIKRENIKTFSDQHFYVADWESIPDICAKYSQNFVSMNN